jgi:pimeloyl-ACP methyl ester carboxylesterase
VTRQHWRSDRSVFCRYAPAVAIKPLGNWPELGRRGVWDLSDGKLVQIAGSGHAPLVEKPEEFEAALTEFLARRFP